MRIALLPTTTAIAALLLTGMAGSAQTLTQTFVLQKGWNAVYLDVTPPDGSPTNLFSGLPVASVWTRADKLAAVAFIQDPGEATFNKAGWLKWYPPPHPAFLSDLRELQGRRAFLINLTNGPVTWQVGGKPAIRSIQWVTDSWNLRGFPVDAAHLPTFRDYFRASANHYDAAQGRLHGVYRLGTDGAWSVPAPDALMKAGEAYWVRCLGASSFTAPLELKLDSGTALDYGQALDRIYLRFGDLESGARTVTINQAGAIPGLLAYLVFNPTNGIEWADLPNPFSFGVTNGTQKALALAIRRSRMPETNYASILDISDGQGTRYTVPVTAQKSGLNYAGLWFGNVSVTAVSQPHFGSLTTNLYVLVDDQATPLSDPSLVITTNQVAYTNDAGLELSTNQLVVQTADGATLPVYEKIERSLAAQDPTPTAREFTMRLLVHVDKQGQARLLKEVVQMWRNGTYTNDAAGRRVLDKPGSYVLLTEDALLGKFQGASQRDGVSVGRRISAIGFDFDGRGTNHLDLFGNFAPGGMLTNQISLAPDYPLNPFRHKYHPDHDNLETDFKTPITDPTRMEVYPIKRILEFHFAAGAAGDAGTLDSGYSVMDGTYEETIIGLHKQPLKVEGTFHLSRASMIAELNPSPTP